MSIGHLIRNFFGSKSSSTSSTSSDAVNPPPGIVQINDSVWEFHNGGGRREVEIIFFHGLQQDDFRNAFWKTWKYRDESVVWPKEWLPEKFPRARILSVSYESSAMGKEGQLDMYNLGENLTRDIIMSRENIGQNCPVILVGHSLGGIVIKQFLLSAFSYIRDSSNEEEKSRGWTFLHENVKGVFYYSTPHHGSRIADFARLIPGSDPYLALLKILNATAQRINEEFRKNRLKLRAKAGAIGEYLPTDYKEFRGVVVQEASARSDIDNYYTAMADHFNVCKPQNKEDGIFAILCDFISTAARIEISEADTLNEQL